MELRRATLRWHPLAEKFTPSSLVKQTVKKKTYTSVFLAVPFLLFLIYIQIIYLTIHAPTNFIFPTGKHLPHIVNRSSRITNIHHAASSWPVAACNPGNLMHCISDSACRCTVDCNGGIVHLLGQTEWLVACKSSQNNYQIWPCVVWCSVCIDNLKNGNCMAFHIEENQIIPTLNLFAYIVIILLLYQISGIK